MYRMRDIFIKSQKKNMLNDEEKEIVLITDDSWTEKDVIKYVIHNSQITNSDKSLTMLNTQKLVNQVDKWKRWMPRITPYYSVKCNDSNIVLEVLASLGLNFDCASHDEIQKVLAIGVDAKRIIYAHTTKPEISIKFAKQNRVDLLTFDSDIELFKIKRLYPSARLLIRVKSDAETAVCRLGNKFGCCPYNEAPTLLRLAKELQLNVVGTCFHVGSLCNDSRAYAKGIVISKDLFKIGIEFGFDMKIVDIGGGFSGETDSDMKNISNYINSTLDEHFPPDGQTEIIAEPGRFFVKSAFTLACLVHSAKRPLAMVRGTMSEDIESTSSSSQDSSDKKNKGLDDDIICIQSDLVQIHEQKDQGDYIVKDNLDYFCSESSKSRSNSLKSNSTNKESCDEIHDAISDFSSLSQNSQSNSIMYFMNNGIYSSFTEVQWKRLTIQPEPLQPCPGLEVECSLWGPTCDGKDMICQKVFLPPLPIPSWLVFPQIGPQSMANGLNKPVQVTYAPKSTMMLLTGLPHNRCRDSIIWTDVTKEDIPVINQSRSLPSHLSFDKTLTYINEQEESLPNPQSPPCLQDTSDSEGISDKIDPPFTINPIYLNTLDILKYNRGYNKQSERCRKCQCEKCSVCFSFLGAIMNQSL